MARLAWILLGFAYWCFIILGLLATFGMLLLQGEILANQFPTHPGIFGYFLAIFIFLVSGPILTLVHEIGHLFAAWLMGLRVVEFRVGRYAIVSGNWFRHEACPTVSGHVRVKAPTGRWARIRFAVMVLGGPLANLVFGAGLLALSWHNSRTGAMMTSLADRVFRYFTSYRTEPLIDILSPHSIPIAIVNFVAFYSLLNFVYNLIMLDDLVSDGRTLYQLLQMKKPERDFLIASIADDFVGKRPCDWDIAAINRIVELSSDTESGNPALLYLYFYHLDSGRVAEARRFLDQVMSALGDRTDRPANLYEASYFHAYHLDDVIAAKDFFARASNRNGAEPQTRMRAEAAIMLADGCYPAARDKAWQAIVTMRNAIDVGGGIAEREWLAQIAIDAESKRLKANRTAKHAQETAM